MCVCVCGGGGGGGSSPVPLLWLEWFQTIHGLKGSMYFGILTPSYNAP